MKKGLDRQLKAFAQDLIELSPQRQATLFSTALNRTGRKAKTRTKRQLSQVMGAPQNRIDGLLREKLSTSSSLTYTLWGNQKTRDLKHFNAYSTKRGLSSTAYGSRHVARRTFFIRGRGGGLFAAKRRRDGGLEKVWGASVRWGLSQDSVIDAFNRDVADFPFDIQRILAAQARQKLKRKYG